jgi:hypothetical protein
MFCSTCRVLLQQLEAGLTSGDQKRTSHNILEDLDTDCCVCFALYDRITESLTETGKVCFLHITWRLMPADNRDYRDIEIGAGYRLEADPDETETWFIIYFQLEPSDSEDVAPYQPPVHTSDPAVAQLLHSWLQVCCHTHVDCSFDQDSVYRPPRLLHIAPSGVRLVDGNQCPDGSGWVTLSHCWGRKPTFLRLTASNFSQFQDRILMDDLPQTFQDAIVLCQRIGPEFLWVDSLCIVQEGDGSKQDWLHHAKAMRAIYRNARLNISAEWAESSSGGLFKGRHPARVDRPAITFRAGPLKGRWTLTWDTESGPLSFDNPLRKRGWVVQERMLSPRVVRFCSDFVRWHCRKPLSYRSEKYPDGKSYTTRVPKSLPLPYPSVAERQPVLTNEAYRSFVDMAHLYSHTALTYPDLDKFPAFAGLAEHYSLLFEDEYIAGFLRGHLPRALGWVRDRYSTEEDMHLGRPSVYRAQSWSWASLDCRTFASQLITRSSEAVQDEVDLCQITSHCIIPCDPSNPYGQLKFASLTLRASLVTCTWEMETAGIYHRVHIPDYLLMENTLVTFDTIAGFYTSQDQARFMAIGARASDLCVIGLLVKRVGGSPATYERIGACVINTSSGLAPFLRNLQSEPTEEIVLV